MTTPAVLAVLFSKGGLGDVGRHAVQAALERPATEISKIKVFSEHPEALEEPNWNCGCPSDHSVTKEQGDRLEIIQVKNWTDLSSQFDGVTAVVQCLGTRQPFLGERVATVGSKAVIDAMRTNNIERVVAMNSIGIGEDKPCAEFHWAGKVMAAMFVTICRREYNDLLGSDKAFRESDRDYVLVRPVGLGEDVLPVNEWFVQKEKFKDPLGINMAKLDCARFMVEEALNPTKHQTAVVVGSDPEKDDAVKRPEQK